MINKVLSRAHQEFIPQSCLSNLIEILSFLHPFLGCKWSQLCNSVTEKIFRYYAIRGFGLGSADRHNCQENEQNT